MIVDCMSCPVRGTRCDDCVVSVLLSSAELPLDPAERQAVSVLVGAGLVRRRGRGRADRAARAVGPGQRRRLSHRASRDSPRAALASGLPRSASEWDRPRYSRAMTSFRAEDRIDPPTASGEAATLLGFLNYQRDTLRWKCSGLTAAQLSTPVAPTTLTLGGLLKHLAVVEAGWLNQFFAGGVVKPSWFDELDQDDPDWSLTSAAGTAPEQLFAWFDESIAVSDQVIADALAGPDGLSSLSEEEDDGKQISLRWIVCHLIEEYARHNGHADLLRESIDGATGE